MLSWRLVSQYGSGQTHSGSAKWSSTSPKRIRQFLTTLLTELGLCPCVAILAISASETTIRACLPQLIEQLQLQTQYCRLNDGSLSLGPFLRNDSNDEVTVRRCSES